MRSYFKPLLCDSLNDGNERELNQEPGNLAFPPSCGILGSLLPSEAAGPKVTQWIRDMGQNDLAYLTQPE